MAISLPSSSSSSRPTPIWSYDVFLSFRGEDTRNIFTAHLYPALCQRGIKTYIDDKDLERGEIISTTLFKAIEESMISIIVLSPNYASSTWCLEELIKILECKKINQQIVLPVFYHVDPSDLRNQRGSFGQVLARHQESFKDDSKVQRWKEALQEVAELAGEHLKDGNEYEFMQKIIRWVDLTIVKSTYKIHIAEYLIGLESRLKDLNIDLGIGKDDITLMIGIYGIGGIGKTTTAKAVFNSIGHKFEARCFLENVREVSSQGINGLNQLQEKLLNELLGNSISHNIGGVGATNIIKHRLCSKMVLIILDDVSESRQLEELAGNHNWFGPGSRIVITTRDQHLLKYHRVDSMYEVQGLVDSQAIQLFCWHAFKRDKPIESYANLTKCIIGYAKGLPLALRVLGSYLWGRSIQQWKSALEKYEESPHMDIYKILKISYDGLDDKEKDIFLDIACFFKGGSLEYVKKMLDSCGFESTIGIARLSEKCLINVSHRYVEMHDLLQEMGKEIVRQKSPKEAGKRSRLWFHEDVRHVLEENTGTNKIEGILLDFPEDHDKIRLHSEAFNKMRILRLFINRNAQFSTDEKPNYLSNELRVLDWPQYPSSFLPSNFRGNNLVEFQMPNSIIKELGGLKSKNLIDMDLYGCHLITKIPDLSSSPNLEKLNVGWCVNLVEVHHSIGFLDKLQSFDVGGCYKLKIFPKRFKLRSLSYFGISQCSNLEDFPEIECEMEFLHELDLCGTSIKELPSSIDNLKGLENLYLEGTSLRKLPSSSGILSQLKVVTLKCCCLSETNFFTIGNYFPVLERLDLSGSDIVIFPPQGVRFDRLRYLTLNRCNKLEKILPLPLSLDRVEARRCKSLASFALLSEITYGNNYIEWIDLYGCHKLFANKNMRPIPSQKEGTNKIEAIWLDFPYGHDKIRLHPKAFKKMKNLRLFINQNAQFSEGPNYLSNELRVFDWPKFPSSFLPSNFCGNNLVEFKMFYSRMKELGDLKSKNLTYMVLSGCEFITKIPDLSSCPNLEMLDLSYCGNLVEIHDSVGLLDKLRILDVSNCSKLRILPKRFKLRSLSYFHISRCLNLEDFPEIECEIELLHELDLWGTSIKELPSSIDNLKGLESLNLSKSRLEKLPSSSGILTRPQELRLEVDDYDWLTCYLKNSSIFHEAGNRLWKAIKVVTLQCCCLSESNFFTNNYFPALETLDLSGSDIVIFPPQGVTFDVLRHLKLNECGKLEEILALPLSLERVEAHECWSLGRFALLSEIPYGNNNIKWIDLYGCHKLFANENLRPIPSREESHSKEQHWANQLKVRDIEIIFPGKRIPSWFNCRMEVCMSDDYESNEYEIDINPPQHWNDIDGIVFYAAFGHKIFPLGRDAINFSVTIHDGSDWKDLYTSENIYFFDDHVWMHWMSYDRQVNVSRLRFRCQHRSIYFPKHWNLASFGIHFLKKHEEWPSSIWELENDDENPNQDLELENVDENPKEVFGKRRRDDEYDCNIEPNWYPKQKRQHSLTMGITITKLEKDDENLKEGLDLDLILGL